MEPLDEKERWRAQGRGWTVALLVCLAGALLSNAPLYLLNRIFCSEDLNAYYRWTSQFTQAVGEGVWRPRWDGLGTEALGSPAFLYLSPFYFYAAFVLRLAGAGVWPAMRLLAWLVTFLAGVVTWRFLRRRVSWRWALAGALGVQTSPILFHLFSLHNLPPMHAAVLPLLWLCFATFDFKTPRVGLQVALATAALMLTHQMAAFMALATLPFFFVPRLLRDVRASFGLAVTWGLSCLLGLGLAGYYLYPALTTQHLILAEEWYEPVFRDWRNSFILPLFTAGRYGMRWFGIQWVLGGLAVLSLAVLAIGVWRSRGASAEDRALRVGITATVAAACFMASEWSFPLWRMVPLLHSVQWPYRFLLVAMPLGVIALVLQAAGSEGRAARWATGIVLLLFLVASAGLPVKNLKVFSTPDFSALRVHDYMRIPVPGEAWKTYLRQGGFAAECAAKGSVFRETVARTHERAWQITAGDAAELRLPLFHFPAWRVTVDGRPVETRADSETSLLTVRLPPGRHEVRVRWAMLPQEKIGLVISLASVLIAGVAAVRRKRTPC